MPLLSVTPANYAAYGDAVAEHSGAGRPDLPALLTLASQLAQDASALLLDGLTRARSSVTTKSTSTDMVTEMDRAAEAFIADGIRSARPDDGIVGEEGTADPGTSGVRWVIDPIDGTTNYLYGLSGFGVSIAAEVDGEAVAGVVADPVRGDLYTATKGGGANLNGSRVRVSALTDLAGALVGTGFAYDASRAVVAKRRCSCR